MEKKYISEARYKKSTTRKRRDSKTVKSNIKSKNEIKVVQKKQPEKKIVKRKIRKKTRDNKPNNIVVCIILIVIIAIISRAIFKDKNEPFIPLPFMNRANEEVIKIGVITTDSLLDNNTGNVVINELNKYSTDMILKVGSNYNIEYECISSVNKISNTEYELIKSEESNVTIVEIKNAIDSYRANEKNIYYTKLQNIQSVTIVNPNKLNIKLKVSDPYFIYNLEISLGTTKDVSNYTKDVNSTSNKLILNRHKNADKHLPLKIIVTKYKDVYAAAQAYKEQEINIFVTNAENVQTILGKYEYNINTYRNGQSIFLIGNPKSDICSTKEVRQAIAYSIDRDGIIKDVFKDKGLKIDLPYIYDIVKYKYDIYAAENLLLTKGYTKSNKVYSKFVNGIKTPLELDLLVNKNDEIKVSIANSIKNNLEAIGIKVNIEKVTDAKLKTRIKNEEYDLILANVNLNNNPNISFIHDKLYVNEDINNKIINIQNSNTKDLNANILDLKVVMSENISTIGIYSDVSYLIYSKSIVGIENISYMNLFKSILS